MGDGRRRHPGGHSYRGPHVSRAPALPITAAAWPAQRTGHWILKLSNICSENRERFSRFLRVPPLSAYSRSEFNKASPTWCTHFLALNGCTARECEENTPPLSILSPHQQETIIWLLEAMDNLKTFFSFSLMSGRWTSDPGPPPLKSAPSRG